MPSRAVIGFFVFAAAWVAGGVLHGEVTAERVALLDRPFQGELIALSPDGRHLAYTVREGDRFAVMIADLGEKKTREFSLVLKNGSGPKALVDLLWANAGKLVFQTDQGDIVAVAPDATNPLKLWSKEDAGDANMSKGPSVTGLTPLPPRIVPWHGGDPNLIKVESNGQWLVNVATATNPVFLREKFSNLYTVDLRTGRAVREVPPEGSVRGAPPLSAMFDDGGGEGAELADALAVNARMYYDRQSQPRMLASEEETYVERVFYYSGSKGRLPYFDLLLSDRGGERITLDAFLGDRKGREYRIDPDNYFAERSFPLAFDSDPNRLFFASSMGRDKYGIFLLDLDTRERQLLAGLPDYDLAGFEPEFPDRSIVFDPESGLPVGVRFIGARPVTLWFADGFAARQRELQAMFPAEWVEIVSWSSGAAQVLARVAPPGGPGRFILADSVTGQVANLLREAPWMEAAQFVPTANFSFSTPSGSRLTGLITLPRKARTNPPALLLYVSGGLAERPPPGFDRDAQILTEMGHVVVRLNVRGTSGFGRSHLTAVQAGLDSVPVEDLRAAIDWVAGKVPIDRTRVVAMGDGFGGYVALSAMKQHPDLFRAAVAIDAPTNINSWVTPRARRGTLGLNEVIAIGNLGVVPPIVSLREAARARFVQESRRVAAGAEVPDDTRRPILVIEGSASDSTTPFATFLGQVGIGMGGAKVQRMLYKGDLGTATPQERAKVFNRIEEFLNTELFEFGSTIRNLREAGPASKGGK